MKVIGWAVAASVVSVAMVIALGAPAEETFFGMLGPVVAVTVTWALIERTHRIDPTRVTSLLLGSFVAKVLFFGGYVVLLTRMRELDVVPFMVSFAAYFIGLYAVQAALIRGLGTRQASPGVS